MDTRARSRPTALTIGVAAVTSLVCLTVATGRAHAQQSAAQGFPEWGPGRFEQVANARPTPSQTGQSAHQAMPSFEHDGLTIRVVAGDLLPARCTQAIEETAASVPPGFTRGSPESRYAESVRRYFARKTTDDGARLAALQ